MEPVCGVPKTGKELFPPYELFFLKASLTDVMLCYVYALSFYLVS